MPVSPMLERIGPRPPTLYTKRYLVFWAVAGLTAGYMLGVVTVFASPSVHVDGVGTKRPSVEQAVVLEELLGRVDALEDRARAQALLRSLTLQADKLDVVIYPVQNVGVHKVPPPVQSTTR